MGRPALGLKYVQVGLREECLAEIEGLVGNGGRAEFIRQAVDAALGQDFVREVEDAAPTAKKPCGPYEAMAREVIDSKLEVFAGFSRRSAGRDFTDDFKRVLAMLGEGTRAVRPLASDLGWEQMRLERVLGKMADAGLVTFEGGVASRVV